MWVVWWGVLLLGVLCLPFVRKGGRTVSKLNVFVVALLCALLTIGSAWFFDAWDVRLLVLLVLAGGTLLLPDFRIVYNISTSQVLTKIRTMLKRLFCTFHVDKHTIAIEGIGVLRVFSLGIVSLILLPKSPSPKARIIFENIFKIFYDEEY